MKKSKRNGKGNGRGNSNTIDEKRRKTENKKNPEQKMKNE